MHKILSLIDHKISPKCSPFFLEGHPAGGGSTMETNTGAFPNFPNFQVSLWRGGQLHGIASDSLAATCSNQLSNSTINTAHI